MLACRLDKIKKPLTKDRDIRDKLCEYLTANLLREQSQTGHPARIFSEFGINHGDIRADIVTINGVMHGYEIKSDADTLSRLHDQIIGYNQVFDLATIVVGEKHLVEIINCIPDWWGIKLAKVNSSGAVVMSNIRPALNNPCQNKRALSRLLWRGEALDLLEEAGLDFGVRTKNREDIYTRLADNKDIDSLRIAVKNILINRSSWRADQPPLKYGD